MEEFKAVPAYSNLMAFLAQPTLMVPNKIKKQIKQIENNLFIGDRVHPSPHQKGRHDSITLTDSFTNKGGRADKPLGH